MVGLLTRGRSSFYEIILDCTSFLALTLRRFLSQLDCGIHPGLEGMDALPYIDLIDPAEIDLLLISQ